MIDAIVFGAVWVLVVSCSLCFGALVALLMGEKRMDKVGRRVWGRDAWRD